MRRSRTWRLAGGILLVLVAGGDGLPLCQGVAPPVPRGKLDAHRQARLSRLEQHLQEARVIVEDIEEARALPANVGPAGVAALERPLGLTVADKGNLLAMKGVFVHVVRLPRRVPGQAEVSDKVASLAWLPNLRTAWRGRHSVERLVRSLQSAVYPVS